MQASTCRTLVLIFVGLFPILPGGPAKSVAQQDEAAQPKAVFAFSIDAEKLFDHEVMDSRAVNAMLETWQDNSPLAASIRNIVRVEGVFCLPESLNDMMLPPVGQPLPMDVLVRIHFDNGAAADDMYAAITASTASEEIEIDGRIYMRPLDEMTNLRLHQLDQRTIEIASEPFLMQDPWQLLGPGLESAWNQMPDQTLRLAIDLEGRRDFVDELVELGMSEARSMKGFIELANVVNDIRVQADLQADYVLDVSVACGGEDEAEQVRMALDGALGLLKIAPINPLVELSRSGASDDAVIARQILDAMTATRDGALVQVMIPRPDNFSEFLVRLIDGG